MIHAFRMISANGVSCGVEFDDTVSKNPFAFEFHTGRRSQNGKITIENYLHEGELSKYGVEAMLAACNGISQNGNVVVDTTTISSIIFTTQWNDERNLILMNISGNNTKIDVQFTSLQLAQFIYVLRRVLEL